jgi:hypothetical protein
MGLPRYISRDADHIHLFHSRLLSDDTRHVDHGLLLLWWWSPGLEADKLDRGLKTLCQLLKALDGE